MIAISLYQIVVLLLVIFLWLLVPLQILPNWAYEYLLPFHCTLIAITGGVLYCLRAIYKIVCVEKNWDDSWKMWYILRPWTSAISGVVSYVFLKSGLLILDAPRTDDATHYGFLAVAFLAGLNVDNFVHKIENVAKVTLGIKPTRARRNEQEDQ